nr:unnamed protein product [Leishmania braziliensis]
MNHPSRQSDVNASDAAAHLDNSGGPSSIDPSFIATAAASPAVACAIASPAPGGLAQRTREVHLPAPHPRRSVQPPLRRPGLLVATPRPGEHEHHRRRHSDGASPLRVLCACDTFKGTLSSDKVGEAVEKGYWQAWAKTHGSATAQSHALPAVTAPVEEVSTLSPTSPPLHLVAPPLATSLLPAQPPSALPADAVRFLHLPMSDGGAGLLDSVTYSLTHACRMGATELGSSSSDNALRLQRVYVPASVPIIGPLGTAITTDSSAAGGAAGASHGVSFACDVERRVLVLEMAEAAGLPRIARAQDRHPGRTTSYGVGELIRYALVYMAKAAHAHAEAQAAPKMASPESEEGGCGGVRLFLGIGGSSTNDGGLGALQALGLEIFVDAAHARATDGGNVGTQCVCAAATSAAADEQAAPCHADDGTDVRLARPFRGEDLAHVTRVRISAEMRCIFPYLPEAAMSPTATGAKRGAAQAVPPANSSPAPPRACYVAEVCLICDVDNALVGPRGATHTFGPQKCAPRHAPLPHSLFATAAGTPPAGSHAGSSAEAEAPQNAVGGAITSVAHHQQHQQQQQQQLLDSLEAGMRHAATRVVASLWRHLAAAADADVEGSGAEAAVLADLLYSPGGGGAGGMSGFFRYVLQACYVPGADVVGGLLGLYETPRVAQLLGSRASSPSRRGVVAEVEKRGGQRGDDVFPVPAEMPAAMTWQPTGLSLRRPRGSLFYTCDVLVSGEGSFDDQTILSHKTVGRLLEMCTVANAYRLWHHYCDDAGEGEAAWSEQRGCRCITDVVVVCGRCGFDDYTHLQSSVLQAVCRTLLLPSTSKDCAAAVAAASPSMRMFHDVAGANADAARLHVYLQGVRQSSTFRRACGESSHAPEDSWSAEHLLSNYCVPRVTVLPLTPMLFPVPTAMQQPYKCIISAVAQLLEESVRRLRSAQAVSMLACGSHDQSSL